MLRLARGWIVLLVLAAVVAGAFGCVGGTASTQPDAVPEVQDPPGPVATTDVDTAAMYSSTGLPLVAQAAVLVDAAVGGAVSNGLVTVQIPPGALAGSDSVRIVMQPGRRLVFDVFVNQAIHDHFLLPVQLTVDLSGQAGVTSPALYWKNPADSLWYGLKSSSYNPATHILSAPVTHFSTYGAGGKAGW